MNRLGLLGKLDVLTVAYQPAFRNNDEQYSARLSHDFDTRLVLHSSYTLSGLSNAMMDHGYKAPAIRQRAHVTGRTIVDMRSAIRHTIL